MVYSGGPYLTIGTIGTYGSPIGPLNIPYQRINDTLQQITENILPTSSTPWEWWITYAGAVRLAARRGQVIPPATLTITVNKNIGKITKEISSKQTAQRVRVVGRGESAEQDLSTSDWFNDETEMVNVGSFYESMDAEKTLSSKDESDIMAQVLLYQNSAIRQEITIKLSNNIWTTNDFDVGDEVTIEDTDYGVHAHYRIKTIENFVDENGGEETYITLTAVKTDVSNRLSYLQKQLEKLQNSSTYLDSKYAEGANQTKISANEIEDIWEQTSSNKWAIELPEDEANDPLIEFCQGAGRGAVSWGCDKDEFEIYGTEVDANGTVFKFDPLLKFSRNPRFTCEFEIDTTGANRDEWQWIDASNLDQALIRIFTIDPNDLCTPPASQRGFGFCIMYNNEDAIDQLELKAYLTTADGNINVKIANLEYDTKYIIEARMEWESKVVLFYFGKPDVDEDDDEGFKLRAILPIRDQTDEGNLAPFHVGIDAGSGATKTAVVIYRWKTQAIRTVKT